MYKVFFNDSTIEFVRDPKKTLNNTPEGQLSFEGYGAVEELVTMIGNGSGHFSVCYKTPEFSLLWDFFRSKFVEIPASGGLVRNNSGEYLFIKRFGVWDLPKGKIEKHETAETAAIREVEEECGISGPEIIRQLDSTFHIYRSPYHKAPKNLVLKETKWFLMQYSGNKPLKPQFEEEIEEARWIPVNELEQVSGNTYLSLKEFLAKNLLSE